MRSLKYLALSIFLLSTEIQAQRNLFNAHVGVHPGFTFQYLSNFGGEEFTVKSGIVYGIQYGFGITDWLWLHGILDFGLNKFEENQYYDEAHILYLSGRVRFVMPTESNFKPYAFFGYGARTATLTLVSGGVPVLGFLSIKDQVAEGSATDLGFGFTYKFIDLSYTAAFGSYEYDATDLSYPPINSSSISTHRIELGATFVF